MGFFDRIFGKEKKEEVQEKKKYDLESVEKILKEKTDEGQKAIEPELVDFHKRLVELDNKLIDSLKELDSAVPKEKMDEKLLFAAVTGRKSFKNKISKVSEAVKKSVDFDFRSFSEYYNDCVFAVNQANALAVAEFRTIAIVFKDEGNKVVDDLRKLKKFLGDVGSRIKQHQQLVSPYEEVLEKILDLRKSVGRLAEERRRSHEMRAEIERKDAELIEMRKSVENLLNSEEWKEYENSLKNKKDLEMREAEIRTQFNEMISSIERPLRKVKRVLEEEQEENKHGKIFEEYINNPFETFLKDRENVLKSFLETTKKILEEKKIDLNENVREKSIGKIDEWISKNIFEKMMQGYETVMAQMKEIRIDEGLSNRKSEIEKKMGLGEAGISELKKRIELGEKRMEENKREMEVMKKEVESKLEEVLNHHCELEVNY